MTEGEGIRSDQKRGLGRKVILFLFLSLLIIALIIVLVVIIISFLIVVIPLIVWQCPYARCHFGSFQQSKNSEARTTFIP